MNQAPQPSRLSQVTVCIVAYNSQRALNALLPQLQALPHVLIVDNASSDETRTWLAQALPNAVVFSQPVNIGFGRAHNLAVQHCTTPFALLLNPDCRIEGEAILQLMDCLHSHPDALMAVPRLVYPDGRVQENHRPFFHSRGSARPAYQVPDGELCCEMVSGAVLMVRTALFRRIGGFDPWFFLYWEDEELCIRARNHQLAVILAPQALACHLAQTSSLPSVRTTFIRHYSYTSSKLYLRRKLGESAGLVLLRGVGTLTASLLALLISALTGQRLKAVRSAARIAAVFTAPWQLRRKQAVSLPSQLWS